MEQTTPQKTNSQHQKALLYRQCYRADFPQTKRLLKQKIQTIQETKARFSQPKITRNG
ncbi:hypothetical protein I7093_005695, partial [Vibrio parahaemolyticus]|nr:hypothetical protein [Vibrio parahaemolyticus]